MSVTNNKPSNQELSQPLSQAKPKFKLGLIVNPVAGLGGSVALKGSDGANTAELAKQLGAVAKSQDRAEVALAMLGARAQKIDIFTVEGDMGANLCQKLSLPHTVIYTPNDRVTTPADTEAAAAILTEQQVDLILFVGGDGTARNICDSVHEDTLVLGVPAGCKIHSGVYAISPKAAGRILQMLIDGELISVTEADVMDIDEAQFRQGVVRAKRFGDMQVPSELRYIQAVKMGGKESDELVLQDIAAHVIESMESDIRYIMGSGSTVAFIMEELGLDNTLLGVDVIQDHELLAQDVTAAKLLKFVEGGAPVKLVITLIGGQGHIFGRGNQQLSPELIRQLGKENILVVATKKKLQALEGRPLIADTGDLELDKALSGPIRVVTGYHDQVLYPVGYEEL